MEGTLRIIGMDIHRVAAEVVSLLDGEITKLGRVQMLRLELEGFARKELTHDDHVVIEATGNAAAVAEVLSGLSGFLCEAGYLSCIHEALVEHDSELRLCLRPLARRAFPFRGGVVEDQI